MIKRSSRAWIAVGAAAATLTGAAVVSAAQHQNATATAGLVSDIGRFNDQGFNQSALDGVKLAKSKLGVGYTAIESKQPKNYIPNLRTLAEKKNTVTIGVGFAMAAAIEKIANKYKTQNFAIVDYPQAAMKSKPKNVRGLVFSTNENSYLIGYLAAKMAKAKNSDVVSAVGGQPFPSVVIFIAGYQAGAKAANPNAKVLIDYSNDFVDQTKCKEKALSQIDQGSQVVFQVAGGCGLGALSAAADRGVWGVGVDKDQSGLGAHILTSAVKRVDTAVFDTVKDAKAGKLKGGDKSYTLKNGGVSLGKISSQVPAALVKEVDGLKAQIIAGKIKIPVEPTS